MKIATATPLIIFHFVSMLYLPWDLPIYVILICLSGFQINDWYRSLKRFDITYLIIK